VITRDTSLSLQTVDQGWRNKIYFCEMFIFV